MQDTSSSERIARNPETAAERILLVEDDVLIRLSLAEDLRAARYLVIEAGNADEALRIIGSGAEVDVLITDVRMPGTIDGLALARSIRNEHPGIRIILVTGQATHVGGFAVDGVFGKPCDPPRLIRHLRRLAGELGGLS